MTTQQEQQIKRRGGKGRWRERRKARRWKGSVDCPGSTAATPGGVGEGSHFLGSEPTASTKHRKLGAMPAVLSRVFFICSLLNSLLLFFLPKRLRGLLILPCTWIPSASLEEKSHPQAPKVVPPSSVPAAAAETAGRLRVPAMDAAELKRVFQMFDRNGDGRITKAELSDSLENLGIHISDSDLVAMIEKIDVNGDGCVDIDEFGALYQSIMDEKDEEEDMREAFNVFDQNGDGFITVEELRSVLASLGLKQGRTVEDCRQMIRKVDVDGDGMVNFKEFKQMMRGGGFAALSG